jgi:hypothetical protein
VAENSGRRKLGKIDFSDKVPVPNAIRSSHTGEYCRAGFYRSANSGPNEFGKLLFPENANEKLLESITRTIGSSTEDILLKLQWESHECIVQVEVARFKLTPLDILRHLW